MDNLTPHQTFLSLILSLPLREPPPNPSNLTHPRITPVPTPKTPPCSQPLAAHNRRFQIDVSMDTVIVPLATT
jgi:hypothetical protein